MFMQITALVNLKSLGLSSSKIGDDVFSRLIRSLSSLTCLNLYECSNLTKKGLGRLSDLRQLSNLDLSFCFVEDETLENLASLSNLQNLTLYSCARITDSGLSRLSSLSKLQVLSVIYCPKITETGVKRLSEALYACKIKKNVEKEKFYL